MCEREKVWKDMKSIYDSDEKCAKYTNKTMYYR